MWVGAQIVRHVDRLQFGASEVSGSQLLDQHVKNILQQIQLKTGALGHLGLFETAGSEAVAAEAVVCPADAVPVPVSPPQVLPCQSFRHLGDQSSVTLVDALTRTPILVRLHSPHVTVEDLLLAERALSAEARGLVIRACDTGLLLPADALVVGKCLWFEPGCADEPMLPIGCDTASVTAVVAEISPTLPWSSEAAGSSKPDETMPLAAESDTKHERPVEGYIDDPLLKLHDAQFVQVLPPKVDSLKAIQALGQSRLPAPVRSRVLQQQVGKWSDDEITWHVLRILHESGKKDWVLLPVLLACECLRRNGVMLISQWLESLQLHPSVIVGVVAVQGHWIPFMWNWTSAGLTASSWDVSGTLPRCLNVLHDAISKAVGARTFLTHTDIRSFAEKDFCGLCAVHWIDHRVRGKTLPTTIDEVHYLHDVARAQYMDFLQTQSSVPRPWIWAAGLDISAQRRLLALLEQHGVPSAQAEGRSQMIVQSLGTVEVQNAMTSSNPWRLLKGIANRQKPPLKLVLPEELEVMIRANKHKIETVGRKKGEKGKGKGMPARPPKLDPEKLAIEDGSFVVGSRQVGQVSLEHLGPLAEGVLITTLGSVEAHLKAGHVMLSQSCECQFQWNIP